VNGLAKSACRQGQIFLIVVGDGQPKGVRAGLRRVAGVAGAAGSAGQHVDASLAFAKGREGLGIEAVGAGEPQEVAARRNSAAEVGRKLLLENAFDRLDPRPGTDVTIFKNIFT
jgi:hypothetical protein